MERLRGVSRPEFVGYAQPLLQSLWVHVHWTKALCAKRGLNKLSQKETCYFEARSRDRVDFESGEASTIVANCM